MNQDTISIVFHCLIELFWEVIVHWIYHINLGHIEENHNKNDEDACLFHFITFFFQVLIHSDGI